MYCTRNRVDLQKYTVFKYRLSVFSRQIQDRITAVLLFPTQLEALRDIDLTQAEYCEAIYVGIRENGLSSRLLPLHRSVLDIAHLRDFSGMYRYETFVSDIDCMST